MRGLSLQTWNSDCIVKGINDLNWERHFSMFVLTKKYCFSMKLH